MRCRESCDYRYKRSNSTKWEYEADEEQQVIRTGEDVLDAEVDKVLGHLVPSRIERNGAGFTLKLVAANSAARCQELERNDHSLAKTPEICVDGEV